MTTEQDNLYASTDPESRYHKARVEYEHLVAVHKTWIARFNRSFTVHASRRPYFAEAEALANRTACGQLVQNKRNELFLSPEFGETTCKKCLRVTGGGVWRK